MYLRLLSINIEGGLNNNNLVTYFVNRLIITLYGNVSLQGVQ